AGRDRVWADQAHRATATRHAPACRSWGAGAARPETWPAAAPLLRHMGERAIRSLAQPPRAQSLRGARLGRAARRSRRSQRRAVEASAAELPPEDSWPRSDVSD